jgi:hypothetical protein
MDFETIENADQELRYEIIASQVGWFELVGELVNQGVGLDISLRDIHDIPYFSNDSDFLRACKISNLSIWVKTESSPATIVLAPLGKFFKIQDGVVVDSGDDYILIEGGNAARAVIYLTEQFGLDHNDARLRYDLDVPNGNGRIALQNLGRLLSSIWIHSSKSERGKPSPVLFNPPLELVRLDTLKLNWQWANQIGVKDNFEIEIHSGLDINGLSYIDHHMKTVIDALLGPQLGRIPFPSGDDSWYEDI